MLSELSDFKSDFQSSRAAAAEANTLGLPATVNCGSGGGGVAIAVRQRGTTTGVSSTTDYTSALNGRPRLYSTVLLPR